MSGQVKLRIGVLAHSLMSWGGGLDFLRMLMDSMLEADKQNELELVVLAPVRGSRVMASKVRAVGRYMLARCMGRLVAVPKYRAMYDLLREMVSTFGGKVSIIEIDSGKRAITKAAGHHGIDVFLPAIFPLDNAVEQPWFGYIYDFQHRHLGHLFSEQEIRNRDRVFAEMLTCAKRVIVNSRDTANDARRFMPQSKATLITLPFSASPHLEWLKPDPTFRASDYKVGDKYFIVCNQFWQHKDHVTALRAFAQLRDVDDLQLVCTGAMEDNRNLGYIDSLLKESRDLGIEAKLRFTGLIPKRHQIELLKGAIALIQPTLFEGGPGGGAVYDSVSLGVPSIVSDIAVNREVDDPTVTFFKAGNPDALAEAMRQALRTPREHIDPELLLQNGRKRRAACGAVLLNAVRAAFDRSESMRSPEKLIF